MRKYRINMREMGYTVRQWYEQGGCKTYSNQCPIDVVIHACTLTEKNDVESMCDWSIIFDWFILRRFI